jgi:hypothetical protein
MANWEAIGAIGEILGAIGVIATLLYLARQTVINTRAVEASSARELTIAESEMHRDLSRDPSLKRTFQKSLQVPMEEYDELEWIEFRTLAMSIFLQFEAHHVDRHLQIGHEEQIQSRLSVAAGLINTFPAWKRYWEQETMADGFSRSFVDAVNSQEDSVDFKHMTSGHKEVA